MVDSALQLADLGWKVLPVHGIRTDGTCTCGCANESCTNRAKHPVIAGWQESASSDPDLIRSWWEKWPRANVGVAVGASELVVVDIDPRNGGDESWHNLLHDAEVQEPATVVSLTGGGGRHLYFKQPETSRVAGSNGRLGQGVDVKGDGGFVVAPSSVHASGSEYAWDGSYSPFETQLAELPVWLSDALSSPVRRTAGPLASSGVAEGSRNDTLFKRAASWRGQGLDRSQAEQRAAAFAASCVPPLPIDEALRVVESAYGRYTPEALSERRPAPPMKLVPATQYTGSGTTQWVVDGVIPAAEVTVLYGTPKTGKTFLAADISFHVSLGLDWNGHSTAKGSVLYILGEGRSGWASRVSAWEAYHGHSPTDTHVLSAPYLNFRDPTWVRSMLNLINGSNLEPKLVVVDTLASVFAGGDENAPDAMGAFVSNCNLVCAETGAALLVVHHPAKSDNASSPRGHGSLIGNASMTLRFEIDKGTGNRNLSCEALRDGAAFAPMSFAFARSVDSVVLVPAKGVNSAGSISKTAFVEAAVLSAVGAGPITGLRRGQLIDILSEDASEATIDRSLKSMLKAGKLQKTGQYFHLPSPGVAKAA